MKYNEWRDELKSNLLCVSEAERRRVLDYYAEAYADRRDAGYTEREIIDEFGAPYDAAQRILSESPDLGDAPLYEPSRDDRRREERERRDERRAEERERREERQREERERREERQREERERREANRQYGSNSLYGNYTGTAPAPAKQRGDYTWVFVLLCILFSIPILMVIIAMVIVAVSFCVAPFAVLVSGIATIGTGVGALFVDATQGAIAIGAGLVIFGVSLIIMPLCFQLVKWMWKLFHMFFAWLKRLFSGKEKA